MSQIKTPSQCPKNIPVLLKYWMILTHQLEGPQNEKARAGFFENVIAHGMEKYGKTRDEAMATEMGILRRIEELAKGGHWFGRPFQQQEHDRFLRSLLFEVRTAYSESSKSRHLWSQYLFGNVVEVGSGGMPMVEHAIQCELAEHTYQKYNAGQMQEFPCQWRSDVPELPFKDATMDAVCSSHLLEDFADWVPMLAEWARIVKVRGHMVILIPDKQAWERALREGQPPNCAHKHEGYPGELTKVFKQHFPNWHVLEDRLLSDLAPDYTIMFVAQRTG